MNMELVELQCFYKDLINSEYQIFKIPYFMSLSFYNSYIYIFLYYMWYSFEYLLKLSFWKN